MDTIKNIIGVITVILAFVGYVPYLRDTVAGKTKPHVYSWFLWGFVTLIAYALQVAGGGGAGAWVTLAATVISFIVFFIGLRNGKKDIALIDAVFFVLAFLAIGVWLLAKQPIVSVILVSAIDMLGFAPTFRKSWNHPYTETFFTYALGSFRHGLSIFALQQLSVLTWLYPVVWASANGLFCLMLIVRRKQLPQKNG